MARRGDNIHKRKDGRWEGRYKDGCKENGTARYRSVYALTYTACKQKLDAIKRAEPPALRPNNCRFSDVLYQWLEYHQTPLKGATKVKYRHMIDTHLLPVLGHLKPSQVTPQVVGSFLDSKLRCGGLNNREALSASYVKTMAIILEAAIGYAADEGWCAPFKKTVSKPSIPKKEPTVLSKTAEVQLLTALSNEVSGVALGTQIALQTGMRLGEVCALSWDDVDFERDILYVRHTVARVPSEQTAQKTQWIVDTPKTAASYRKLPLPSALKQVLLRAYLRRTSDFVVSDGPRFVSPRTFDYRYRKLLQRSGIPVVNFHALRHTFATRCAENGMDAKTLSCLLGHATATTTLNIYVHPSMENAKRYMDRLYQSA